MSAGLIDWIFENLDVQHLDRKQVKDYLIYLKEIVGQESSLNKIVKYYSYKISLEKRLVHLDLELVNASVALDINLKKVNKSYRNHKRVQGRSNKRI